MAKHEKRNCDQSKKDFTNILPNEYIVSENQRYISSRSMEEGLQKSFFVCKRPSPVLAPLKIKKDFTQECHPRTSCPDNCTRCLRRLLVEMRKNDK